VKLEGRRLNWLFPEMQGKFVSKNERSWRDWRLPPTTAFWRYPLIHGVNPKG
jgi:hypothetical protein